MTAIRPPGLESFLRKPDPAVAAILIYGDEPGAVRDLAAKTVRKLAGSLDDPFAVITLQDSELAGDPGRLIDEVQSRSMFGDIRVVWLREAGEAFAKACAPLLDGRVSGNRVIAEAGMLSKASGLRNLFEKSPHGLILPLYDANPAEAGALARSVLMADGIRINEEVLHRFIELAGTSRSLVQREAEKLALYCMGLTEATLADVEAVCGNDTGAAPDQLADSVMAGEVVATDRLFQALVAGGTDAGRLLSAVHAHAMQLQDIKAAVERGGQAAQLLRSARPTIFFKRHDAIQTQLRAWSMADLVMAGSTLGQAVLQTRQMSFLGEAIASRCLLSLARKGLALRQDGK